MGVEATADLGYFSWSTRQRLVVDALSGACLHFGIMQEVDPNTVASWQRWGAEVHFHETTRPDPPTCTFARAAFITHSEQLYADITTRTYEYNEDTLESWLQSYSIVKYDFKFHITARSDITPDNSR